jgi:phosphate uptake regulator
MSIQDLLKAWRGEGFLWEETDVEEYKRSIRERDLLVNKAERSIRKKIIRHLAINPGFDTNQSLILMSVVKDAERLGDYAKNLVEVREYHTTYKDKNDLVPKFKNIQANIQWMFQKVGHAFQEADEQEAHDIISKMAQVTEDCDKLIEEILDTEGLSVRQAVSYALLARYYKRFGAHLGNIATSLVMPTHKLDYFDEDEFGKR